jgi:two-component system nitrogen regulation response regulator NtrX
MSVARRILIVDDEQGIRATLGQLLEFEGYEVRAVGNAVDAIAEYQKQRPDLVFLDVKMAGIDGVEALKKIKESDPTAIVVMISGHATIQTAVEATQLGAYDILEKPLDTDRILVTLRNALQHLDLHEENARLRETIQSRYEIVGRSFGIRSVIDKIDRVAKTPARVLITGENGTGKELVARAIHAQSTRADGPFVEVNCAAIPSELIESELFGHMKGSFTGAVADRAGKFEQAHHGTIFLDEVGDMSLAAQAKVLRVLQDGVVTRIGGAKQVEVDVRVLSATNKNLESEIAESRFREDLFYRLNVVPINVPPLRERREDIPLLVAHFVNVLTKREGVATRTVAPDAVERLSKLDWPGNVRELRNTIERLLILAAGPRVNADDVGRLVGRHDSDQAGLGSLLDCKTFEEFKHAAERAFLLAKLREFDWNVSETARGLDMPRSNLYKKIERYGLTRESVT